MSPDQLQRYRRAVLDETAGADLEVAVTTTRGAGLDLEGTGLLTAPRGYPRAHPRIELLRMTSVVAGRARPAGAGISRGVALDELATTWRSAQPLVSWFDEHVGPPAIPG